MGKYIISAFILVASVLAAQEPTRECVGAIEWCVNGESVLEEFFRTHEPVEPVGTISDTEIERYLDSAVPISEFVRLISDCDAIILSEIGYSPPRYTSFSIKELLFSRESSCDPNSDDLLSYQRFYAQTHDGLLIAGGQVSEAREVALMLILYSYWSLGRDTRVYLFLEVGEDGRYDFLGGSLLSAFLPATPYWSMQVTETLTSSGRE